MAVSTRQDAPSAATAVAAPSSVLPVAVVFVAYNSGPALAGAVYAALAENPGEVVVVDNGSKDGSTAFLLAAAKAHPRVRVALLPMAKNEGFAAGCNAGVAASSAPYVLFLNDDAIVRPGYLRTLVAALKAAPKAASAIGKVVYTEAKQQRIDSAGIVLLRYALRPQDRGQDELDVGQYDAAETIFAPTGAAALYDRRAFNEVGGFDAKLFAYYEDVDLGWRCNRAGWHHLYVPAAVAEHRRRGPRNKPTCVEVRAYLNRYRVFARNESKARFLTYGGVALAWEAVRLARIARHRPNFVQQIVRNAPAALRGQTPMDNSVDKSPGA